MNIKRFRHFFKTDRLSDKVISNDGYLSNYGRAGDNVRAGFRFKIKETEDMSEELMVEIDFDQLERAYLLLKQFKEERE